MPAFDKNTFAYLLTKCMQSHKREDFDTIYAQLVKKLGLGGCGFHSDKMQEPCYPCLRELIDTLGLLVFPFIGPNVDEYLVVNSLLFLETPKQDVIVPDALYLLPEGGYWGRISQVFSSSDLLVIEYAPEVFISLKKSVLYKFFKEDVGYYGICIGSVKKKK